MFTALLDPVLDLLYPRNCSLCENRIQGHPSLRVCEGCLRSLAWRDANLCGGCGKPRPQGLYCPDCAGRGFAFDAVASYGPYSGDLKRLIHDFKFNKKKSTGRDLARCMARDDVILRAINDADALVAVPLHPLRQKERGFDQSEVLALEWTRMLAIIYLPGLLVKCRPTPPQAQLGRAERWENAKEAFALARDSTASLQRHPRVILVDDVLTTGATAHCCAQLLKAAGAAHVTVVVVARSVDSLDQKLLA